MEMGVRARLGFGENPLTGCRLPTLCGVVMRQKEGKRALWGPVLKDPDPIPEGSWPNHVPKAPRPTTLTVEGSDFNHSIQREREECVHVCVRKRE